MTQVCASVRWHLFCDASSDNGNALIALSVYVWCQLSYIVLLRYTYFGENIYFVFLLLFIKGVNASLSFFFSSILSSPSPPHKHTHAHTESPLSCCHTQVNLTSAQSLPTKQSPEFRSRRCGSEGPGSVRTVGWATIGPSQPKRFPIPGCTAE